MDFGEVISRLKGGKGGLAVRRDSWDDGTFVVKQVPSCIDSTVIPKMQSLPYCAKRILRQRQAEGIYYRNQLLIIDKDNNADSWSPSCDDIFAEDWEIYDADVDTVSEERSKLENEYNEIMGYIRATEQWFLPGAFDLLCEQAAELKSRIDEEFS
jgi:hypothetical protein